MVIPHTPTAGNSTLGAQPKRARSASRRQQKARRVGSAGTSPGLNSPGLTSSGATAGGLGVTGGFRPPGRRRVRMLIGAAVSLVAVGGNLVIYSSMDERIEVLQVVRDIPAGSQIEVTDLRVVEVWLDPRVNAITIDRSASVVGAYAKVRLVTGSLLVAEAVQADSLVTPGAAVVAVQLSEGAVPLGLRERSEILVVVPPPPFSEFIEPEVVPAVVIAPPRPVASSTGRVAISLEVAIASAVVIARAEEVRILLLDPTSVITREDLLAEQTTSQGQGS